MAKKKSPPAPAIDYLGMIRERFPTIPASQNDVLKFITIEKNRRKEEKLPPLNEGRMVDTAANYFWNMARAANPGLGIDERTGVRTASTYNNASKTDVRWRFNDAHIALAKAVPDLPAFFNRGSTMTVLMEGLALPKNASHTDTSGTYLGIAQMGAPALFAAWPKLQETVSAMASALPDGHSYKNVKLAGAKLWENAGAVHVQLAAMYADMLPDLKRLDGIASMNETQKAALMPVLNTIPGVGRYMMSRMEQGVDAKTKQPVTPEDIKLSEIKDPTIRKMMANNPRVYVREDYKDDKKLSASQNMQRRMAHFKDNMGDVLNAVERNAVKDAYEVIAQTDPKEAASARAAAARIKPETRTPQAAQMVQAPAKPEKALPASPTQVMAQNHEAPQRAPIRITVTPGPNYASMQQQRVAENVPPPLPRASPLRTLGKLTPPASIPPQKQPLKAQAAKPLSDQEKLTRMIEAELKATQVNYKQPPAKSPAQKPPKAPRI